MTCVIAIRDNDGKIWMGADSCIVKGKEKNEVAGRKIIFYENGFMLGGAGLLRVLYFLRWNFIPPKHPEGMDTDEYIHTIFSEAFYSCLKKSLGIWKKATITNPQMIFYKFRHSFVKRSNHQFIIAYGGQLYKASESNGITNVDADFVAIGSGANIARGALHVLKDSALPLDIKLIKALEAAVKFTVGIEKPFYIASRPCACIDTSPIIIGGTPDEQEPLLQSSVLGPWDHFCKVIQ